MMCPSTDLIPNPFQMSEKSVHHEWHVGLSSCICNKHYFVITLAKTTSFIVLLHKYMAVQDLYVKRRVERSQKNGQ